MGPYCPKRTLTARMNNILSSPPQDSPSQVAQTHAPGLADHALASSAMTEEEKAARMLEIFSERRFERAQTIQRLRFRLLAWVIRTKIRTSLKRALDIMLASLAVIFLSPIFLLITLVIKLDSPGPVIFKQVRIGKWGKPFHCYKFRSMYVDAEARKAELMEQNEADEIVFKMKADPRVTRVGRFIRKASIDELPQLFNVLKGEMSLVGPRPPVPIEVVQYEFETMFRLDAVPGITGLQQVSGRSDLSFKRWIELDLQYIAEQSLLKDIEILLKTIPAVISGKGAY
jgi:exopolysaccharide biosynthesis polyprenyl glycosylphosphotransferase